MGAREGWVWQAGSPRCSGDACHTGRGEAWSLAPLWGSHDASTDWTRAAGPADVWAPTGVPGDLVSGDTSSHSPEPLSLTPQKHGRQDPNSAMKLGLSYTGQAVGGAHSAGWERDLAARPGRRALQQRLRARGRVARSPRAGGRRLHQAGDVAAAGLVQEQGAEDVVEEGGVVPAGALAVRVEVHLQDLGLHHSLP